MKLLWISRVAGLHIGLCSHHLGSRGIGCTSNDLRLTSSSLLLETGLHVAVQQDRR